MIAARTAGWRVVSLLCSLRPEQAERRWRELRRACAVLGIEPRLAGDELLRTRARDDAARVHELAVPEIDALLAEFAPALVLSPTPHDGHPAHEAVARAVAAAMARRPARTRWAMWSWWGELGAATTVAGFDETVLDRAQTALAEHAGELERLDLAGALAARARWQAATGPERVLGPGERAPGPAYADLLCEVLCDGDRRRWSLAAPRVGPAAAALTAPRWSERDPSPWLTAPSAGRLIS